MRTASPFEEQHAAQPLLAVDSLGLRFGGVCALDGVSFAVRAGSICGIIGPNGAGKTSLFNCLSRIYDATSGTIRFAGHDLARMPSCKVAGLGIARTFQNVALFDNHSVRWNIEAGCFLDFGGRHLAAFFNTRAACQARARMRQKIERLLDFTQLGSEADTPVADLSFGTRKRVELARALAMNPRLLLLDEPAAGLNHEEVAELESWIRQIRDAMGVAVLLIEHHMNLVMRVSDQVVVMEFGRKIADGTPEEVGRHPEVLRAYLGSAQ